MAISIRIDPLLHARRMSLAELSDRVGIPASDLDLLRRGGAHAIRFATLDALCTALRCQPGDILAHDPGPAAGEAPGQPG